MSTKEIIGALILLLFFASSILATQEFSSVIVEYFNPGILGMTAYILAGTLPTVIAPISTVALIPLAVMIWGPTTTAIMSIIGWTIGSVIAFMVARRFGKPLLVRFVDLRDIERYERVLGEKYVFWNILFLRMVIPVDILSYAIGLFTSINIGTYTLTTIIGITPFAFIFSYTAHAPFLFQVGAGILILLAIYLGYRKVHGTQ